MAPTLPTAEQLAPIVIQHAQYVHATRYVQVAAMTILFYDHLLTLQEEVDFVWRGAHTRSWPRVLFLGARYIPVAAILANSSGIFPISHSIKLHWLLFHGWTGFAFFAAVQVISQMRLWAVYRSKIVLLLNGIIIVIGLVAMGLIEGLGYRHVKVTSTPFEQKICGPGTLPHYVYAFWIPPIIIEGISCLMVLSKAIKHYREGSPKEWATSRFMRSIARYSVTYFVIVLAVYLANFYVWRYLTVPAFEIFIPLTFALPSVAGNRMLLSLRSIFYTHHALTPGTENITMKVIESDRGVTIQAQEAYNEFESFFGEHSSTKALIVPGVMIRSSSSTGYH